MFLTDCPKSQQQTHALESERRSDSRAIGMVVVRLSVLL